MKLREIKKCVICVETFRALSTSNRKNCSSKCSQKYQQRPENKAKRKECNQKYYQKYKVGES